MNYSFFFSLVRCGPGLQPLLAGLMAFFIASSPATAAPGAHGPNGEHLDAPTQTNNAAGQVPRFEARSEAFELVGRLQGGELSLLINRYETNEPVLAAKVEVESGSLKASAPFHADMGDYAVDDAAMLKALAEPGEHPLVITILAGADSDLLDGTLTVPGAVATSGHGHSHEGGRGFSKTVWLALALVVLVAIGWWFGRGKPRAVSPSVGGAQ